MTLQFFEPKFLWQRGQMDKASDQQLNAQKPCGFKPTQKHTVFIQIEAGLK